jgi:hypothetical protein
MLFKAVHQRAHQLVCLGRQSPILARLTNRSGCERLSRRDPFATSALTDATTGRVVGTIIGAHPTVIAAAGSHGSPDVGIYAVSTT